MKTKEQIQKQIEEKQKELDQLKQELQTAKSPKDDWMDEYDSIRRKMEVLVNCNLRCKDEEHKILWLRQIQLMEEMQLFAKLRNGDWVADWGAESQYKYGIELSENKCRLQTYCHDNPFVYGISFNPDKPEIAKEALEIFGDRIEQFYGK